MPEYRIGDRQFRNQKSYEAGLRDQNRINKLRDRADHTDLFGKQEILARMENGTYSFETILGTDFVESFRDEVYRLELGEDTEEQKGDKKSHDRNGKAERKLEEKQKKIEKKQEQKRKKSLHEYDAEMQKIILEEVSNREKKRKKIRVLSFVVAFVCMVAFGVNLFMDLKDGVPKKQVEEEKEVYFKYTRTEKSENTEQGELTILPEFKGLVELNPNLIGWVKVEGTNIDYPVLRTDDREYYLSHDFDGNLDKNGTIFMDPDCNIEKRSTNLILYGHNMRSGKMFGTLSKYKKYDFYQEHRVIEFDTIYETGTYEVMYAFQSKVYYEDEITFKYYQFIDAVSEEAFRSNLEAMAEMSFYDTGVQAVYGDELLTLSTCDNSEKHGRFVVVARRID